MTTALSHSEARSYYDRFGRRQDSQGFYEDPALDAMIGYSDFDRARAVFEFGCGTGKLAQRLLAEHLVTSTTYQGCDLSPVMVDIACRRLRPYSDRATIIRTDGSVRFPLPDRSVDRVVSSYVLDLLSDQDARSFFAEAHRVLVPGGRVCLASLTQGMTVPSRIVSALWTGVFQVRPSLVGGCRPIRIDPFLSTSDWRLVHQRVVTPFGVPSVVLVASAT